MIKAQIEDQSFQVSESNGEVYVNEELFDLSLEQIKADRFHVVRKDKSYRVQVIKLDKKEKVAVLEVNNHRYEVSLKNKLDLLLEELGMENVADAGANEVKAPMPGLILQVMVEEGQEIKKGDPLLILEAMKMENVLKSPTDGNVTAVGVEVGQSVEKGKVLIKL